MPITAERSFAGLSLPLDALKPLATAHRRQLNDIVLALCAGTLRRYLAHRGGVPRQPLMAAMPISLRDAGNAEYTTQATMSLVNLDTHIVDPVRAPARDPRRGQRRQGHGAPARGVIPTDFPSIGMPWLLHGLARCMADRSLAGVMPVLANVVISNIPGPRVPLFAAGARMSAYWPVSIVEHGLGLNITAISYADAMGFGFTAARAAVPDAHRLTHALVEAFDELVARKAR